jgi:hypothetical protein
MEALLQPAFAVPAAHPERTTDSFSNRIFAQCCRFEKRTRLKRQMLLAQSARTDIRLQFSDGAGSSGLSVIPGTRPRHAN